MDFRRVMEKHGGMVWRIVGSYEADLDLRRDLHQEVLVALWRALPKFRGEANLRTYIARIAHFRGVSHVGKETARPKTTLLSDEHPFDGATPEDFADQSTKFERLAKAIRSLPLDQRQPVTLTLEGFTPKEIGETLGISANAVSIRLTRAKAVLKAALEAGHE